MPDHPQRDNLIHRLHASEKQVVIATTGGGTLAISDLLSRPGASRTVLEAYVPYSEKSLSRLLCQSVVQSCSERTARQIAMSCFNRGIENAELKNPVETRPAFNDIQETDRRRRFSDFGVIDYFGQTDISVSNMSYRDKPWVKNLIGLGCTASLASDRPKKGEHRFHLAIQTCDHTSVFSLILQKGARTREEEERLLADFILKYLAEAADLKVEFPIPLLPGEEIRSHRTIAEEAWIELIVGNAAAVLCLGGKQIHIVKVSEVGAPLISAERPISPEAEFMQNIFAGSFAPIHQGHVRMIEIAKQKLFGKIALEITVRNVDKAPLDYIEIEKRLRGIEDALPEQAVWLSRTVRFIDKSRLFRNATFLVGADTLQRIGDAAYYGNNHSVLMGVLRTITYSGCRFLVFARPYNGKIESLRILSIPDMLRSLSEEVPEEEFCDDISSSAIRMRNMEET